MCYTQYCADPGVDVGLQVDLERPLRVDVVRDWVVQEVCGYGRL